MQKTKEKTLNLCHILESAINSLSDGILILDAEGHLLLGNPALKEMFSLKELCEGKHYKEFVKHRKVLEVLQKHFEKKEEVSGELELSKGEQTVYYTFRAVPLIQKGRHSASLIIFKDVTKIRQLENVRKEFVANVSHELKTPLTAIKGYVETLLDGDLEDPELTRKFLEIIKNQTNRFILLVEDLLTLSRIEFKDIKVVKRWFSIEKVIDDTFDVIKDKAEQKGLYLKKEIKASPEIYSDPDRLAQILLNLVDNAVKFTKTGGVTVKFYQEDGELVLEVKDTGIGIPEKFIPKIGQRFFRVDPSRSRKRGGTGLGMAIVKHLVKLLNYRMEIKSKVGKGTSVKIYLPLSCAEG